MISEKQFDSIESGDVVYLKSLGAYTVINGFESVYLRIRVDGYPLDLRASRVEAIKRKDSHEWEYCINGVELKSINIPFRDECMPKIVSSCTGLKMLLAYVDQDGDYVTKRVDDGRTGYLIIKDIDPMPTEDPKKEAIKNRIQDAKKALELAEKELEELS